MSKSRKQKNSHVRNWKRQDTNTLNDAQEQVFLTMQRRKLEREWNGRKERVTNNDKIALLVLLVILYGAGAASYTLKDDYTITLNIKQMLEICLWILGVAFITCAMGRSKFISILYWILVYWPLCALFTSVALSPFFSDLVMKYKITLAVFGVIEVLTIIIFFVKTYFYPFFINTRYFRETLGAAKFWGIRVVSDWAMTYEASITKCNKRYACKYEGEFNESGLPHGSGQWIDDSYWGELLSGAWENGRPVAPYISRQYGTGDTFCAVTIAYFMASDDEFDANKLVPTDEMKPRCGVASVECSIQGAFYNNLPEASKLYGPFTFGTGENETTLTDCFLRLRCLNETSDENNRFLTISSNDPRGVEVHGHVYEPTCLPFSQDVEKIVIDIHREANTDSGIQNNRNFLPLTSSAIFEDEVFHALIDEDEKKDNCIPRNKRNSQGKKHAHIDDLSTRRYHPATLSIQNWTKDTHKTALVYVGGFTSPLKKTLESLGQLIALTNLSHHVYPVVYQWPCGQTFSYPFLAEFCFSDRTKEHFQMLLKGLQEAGIRNVHFMSHSIGIQTLLGVMNDNQDGSRSKASMCFRLDHDFAPNENKSICSETSMVCKSITILNPDFPVDVFVDKFFIGIRRICNHITIVGDKTDRALFISRIMGYINYFGYKQPDELTIDSRKGFKYQKRIGRDLRSLYFPSNEKDSMNKGEGGDEGDIEMNVLSRNLFQFREVPPFARGSSEIMQDRQWLDIDVIDTSDIDTNSSPFRHSVFNTNPILLKDLEELIITGRRATNRSTLIHREGNIFSYAHAPSFMTL